MVYCVYALFSPKWDKIYIGCTSNLHERIKSHNLYAKKGYTLKYRPWVLVYSEELPSKQEALKREKQLKSALATLVSCLKSIL